MVIREMSRDECLLVLPGARLARLACAHESQPYIVPVYLTYHQSSNGDPCFYGFTTFGQKVAWMRANPLVCVEIEQIATGEEWVSIIAVGRYEEVTQSPANDSARGRLPEQSSFRHPESNHEEEGCENEAWQVLKAHPTWQEPGSAAWAARANHNSITPLTPVFYRIRVENITGHEAVRDFNGAISHTTPAPFAFSEEGSHNDLHAMLTENVKAEGGPAI